MPKIAVCDDEKESVIRLKEMILSSGIPAEIDCYESGESLTKSGRNYDIIFLDIDMGGMNGIETAKIIRGKDKNVKIIYVNELRGICPLCVFRPRVWLSFKTGESGPGQRTAAGGV